MASCSPRAHSASTTGSSTSRILKIAFSERCGVGNNSLDDARRRGNARRTRLAGDSTQDCRVVLVSLQILAVKFGLKNRQSGSASWIHEQASNCPAGIVISAQVAPSSPCTKGRSARAFPGRWPGLSRSASVRGRRHLCWRWASTCRPPDVSHCISLSAYLIDAIVISRNPPKRYRMGGKSRDNHAVDIGGRARARASSYWETP